MSVNVSLLLVLSCRGEREENSLFFLKIVGKIILFKVQKSLCFIIFGCVVHAWLSSS